jgi:hypothetical protein
MKRSGKIAAPLALVGALIALATPISAAAETVSPAERLAQESVLRLSELPAGYVLGEWFCGRPPKESEYEGIYEREEENPPSPYEAFVDKNEPTICYFPYERLYRPAGSPSGPPVLEAFTMVTPNAAAADAGLGVGAELVTSVFDLGSPGAVRPTPPVGEAARLFRGRLLRHWQRADLPGSVELWRDGKILGGIFAAGGAPVANDVTANHYAAVQQTVIESPRPYQEAEAEDIPTYLDNPNLGVPVYWLGKEFKSGPRLTSYFLDAFPRGYYRMAKEQRMTTQYNTDLFLDSWTPAGWRMFAKTEVGRRQWTWHCTRSRTVKLPNGHAVIYASYRTGYATCPSFKPHHFIAHVFLPGAVVAIGQPLCRYCQGDLGPGFESFKAMESIVRGLHRWRPGEDVSATN